MPEKKPDEPSLLNIKGRNLVCENTVWKIYLDHVSDNRGVEIEDYVVLESREGTFGDKQIAGVGVLPVVEGKLGLLRMYRYALKEYFWEVPRGGVDKGELPDAAALRELKEETGLVCSEQNLDPMGYIAAESSTIAARAALFVARDCKNMTQPAEGDFGLGALEFFSRQEVKKMADTSVIEDVVSLTLIYRYLCSGDKNIRAV